MNICEGYSLKEFLWDVVQGIVWLFLILTPIWIIVIIGYGELNGW